VLEAGGHSTDEQALKGWELGFWQAHPCVGIPSCGFLQHDVSDDRQDVDMLMAIHKGGRLAIMFHKSIPLPDEKAADHVGVEIVLQGIQQQMGDRAMGAIEVMGEIEMQPCLVVAGHSLQPGRHFRPSRRVGHAGYCA